MPRGEETIPYMIAQVLDRHIEITPGVAGGKPRIAGHRITVQNIVITMHRKSVASNGPNENASHVFCHVGIHRFVSC
jgi:hypothetical protein